MSINEPKQTKAERREQAREARQQAEANAVQEAARKRRIWLIGGLVAIIAIVVVGVVIATSGGDKTDLSGTPNGSAEVSKMFAGLPQQGTAVGKPDAPVTLVEFADLKCPVCREFDVNSLPTIVDRFVKTGKVRLEIKLLHFVGVSMGVTDSETAARFSVAAGFQGKQWNFAELFYFNQQDESTAYADEAYLKWLAKAIPGLNADKALQDAKGKKVSALLDAYNKEFSANGFTGTPSFLIGKTGGKLEQLMPAGGYGDPQSFVTQIEGAIAAAK